MQCLVIIFGNTREQKATGMRPIFMLFGRTAFFAFASLTSVKLRKGEEG